MTKERSLQPLPCACATLRRAARAVTQLYDAELRPAGLRSTQFTLLQALASTEPKTQGWLGHVLALDSTTLTRALKLLSNQGWVSSEAGEDRRERYWRLTAKGRRQLEQATPHWERAQRRLGKALKRPAWKELLRAADAATRAAL